MRRSIRWRVQLWYGLVLLAVVAGNGCVLYSRARSARFREIDADLAASAAYLDTALRPPPPPDKEKEKDKERDPERPKRPPPPRVLNELRLPQPHRGPGGPPGRDERGFAVWGSDGTLLKAEGSGVPLNPPHDPGTAEWPRFIHHPGRSEVAILGPRRTTILVWRWTGRAEEELHALAWQLVAAGAAVLAVGLVGGYFVASRGQGPLTAISETASRISAANLSQRIAPESADSESGALITVLNATFDRLEAAFERQARFTADASHELRTPLAVIRAQVELALMRPRAAEDYRESLEVCHKAALRMTAIVDGLLVLARADAGLLDLRRESVALDQVVRDGVALIEPLAREKGVSVETILAPSAVVGDSEALARVVSTLLTNAVQYNRPGGRVQVTLAADKGEVILTVADTGVGISEEDRRRVFDRFYQVDPARARASGGTGLGLAICKSMAESHGGSVEVESRPGAGSTFRVRLPLGAAARTV